MARRTRASAPRPPTLAMTARDRSTPAPSCTPDHVPVAVTVAATSKLAGASMASTTPPRSRKREAMRRQTDAVSERGGRTITTSNPSTTMASTAGQAGPGSASTNRSIANPIPAAAPRPSSGPGPLGPPLDPFRPRTTAHAPAAVGPAARASAIETAASPVTASALPRRNPVGNSPANAGRTGRTCCSARVSGATRAPIRASVARSPGSRVERAMVVTAKLVTAAPSSMGRA